MPFAALTAFFKLHPLKDIFWGVVIVAVLVFGVRAYFHVKAIGAQQVMAADAKLSHQKEIDNARIEATAAARAAAAVSAYQAANPPARPVVVPHLVCRDASHGSRQVRGGATASSGSDGAGARVPERSGAAQPGPAEYDPAPAVIQTGRDADAEIEHLQKKVKLLQAMISIYQDAGLVEKR